MVSRDAIKQGLTGQGASLVLSPPSASNEIRALIFRLVRPFHLMNTTNLPLTLFIDHILALINAIVS